MKRWPECLAALVAVLTTLQGQGPEPLCGLPALTHAGFAAPAIISKADPGTQNPTFLIREHFSSQTLIEVEFSLMHRDSAFEVYAETSEVDGGRVDPATVTELVAVFRDHTFEGSINADVGIKAIAEDVFGPPPDIDHNGKVFILLIDVRDDFDPDSSESFIAGYFDPLDQMQQGNLADIIYLDTNPGTLTGPDAQQALMALAHEYQHLIHYGRDRREALWVNEGLSELAPTLMGLPHREFSRYLADTNVRLDSFDGEIADYARCGLFFLYAWVQLGTQFIRDLVASTETDIAGVDEVLASYLRSELISFEPELDTFAYHWHRANFVQGVGLEGYGSNFNIPRPAMHDVILNFPQNAFDREVRRLGARWVLITGGRDLYLLATRDGSEPALALMNGEDGSLLPARGLLTSGIQDTDFGIAYQSVLVMATPSGSIEGSARFTLYVDADGGHEEVTLSFDGNLAARDMLFISLGEGELAGEAAVKFDIVEDQAELAAVQFMAGSSASMEVRVYSQALSPSGLAYSATVAAPLDEAWTTHRLTRRVLVTPGPVYVGIRSTGNALAYNEQLATSHSYYQAPGGGVFAPLTEVKVDDEFLTGNWSIRSSYLLPATPEEKLEVPLIAGQFYPNPLGDAQAAWLEVSPGQSVELVLYNLLGQEVRRLRRTGDEFAPFTWNGRLENGAAAPSGVYLATLRAGASLLTRKIVLLR